MENEYEKWNVFKKIRCDSTDGNRTWILKKFRSDQFAHGDGRI